jgi:outer membrane protein
MGQAEAQDLVLDGGPLYDPLANYRRVSRTWSDWASDPRHPIAASRTVDPSEAPPAPIVTTTTVPALTAGPPQPATGSEPVPGVTQTQQ